ncbi:MAG: PP2C family protein-serine/threonine phosphatase [Phycisphaerales bacterium]
MTKSPDTSQVLFRREYEHELETWLRVRFGYLCTTFVALGLIQLIASIFGMFGPNVSGAIVTAISTTLTLCIVAYFFLERDHFETREAVLGGLAKMILAMGAVSMSAWLVAGWFDWKVFPSILLAIFFWHFTACLFLPWTPGESLRPIIPLMAVWAGYTLFFASEDEETSRVVVVIFGPGILIPGLLICAWRLRRHSRRFRSTMLGRHFRTLRQEFTRARGIHEAMFPAEYDDGYVRFQYTYVPMRELGGDFLHLHIGAEGVVHLTLIDVTGHGLAAALTVNRLHGELERIRGETPRATPAEVLQLLNRYINLTMARHNIYATAIILQLDPYAGEIRWASAGHPPAFLRGVNGVVRQLPATGVVLGALADEEFEAPDKSMELVPGDVVVAYTDGAFEARDRMGRQLGLDSLRDILHGQPSPKNWPKFICSYVDKHKAGRAEDDVLVTALTFVSTRLETKSAEAAVARS